MRISDWSSDVCSSDLPGPTDAADAVHVRVGRRRHVVVEDVGELVDVEAARRHVGGQQELRGAVAQAGHHPVALGLVHAAVQRLGAVAPAVEAVGQVVDLGPRAAEDDRSEEHTSELQSLMRISYAVFCLKKKYKTNKYTNSNMTMQ